MVTLPFPEPQTTTRRDLKQTSFPCILGWASQVGGPPPGSRPGSVLLLKGGMAHSTKGGESMGMALHEFWDLHPYSTQKLW